MCTEINLVGYTPAKPAFGETAAKSITLVDVLLSFGVQLWYISGFYGGPRQKLRFRAMSCLRENVPEKVFGENTLECFRF